MSWCLSLWRGHSLSIVLGVIGVASTLTAFQFPEGKWFDLFLGVGQGCLTVVLFYGFAGYLREKNKPEDP
jgi:hypothetical protein